MSYRLLNSALLNSSSAAIFAIALLFSPSNVLAQGQTFSDCDAWTAAVCGSIVDDDFESFVGFDGEPVPENFVGGIPTPQTVLWGEVSQDGNAPAAVAYANIPGTQSLIFYTGRPALLSPNGVLGQLEGVCFSYRGVGGGELGMTFTAFDGDTVVATQTVPFAVDDLGAPIDAVFGWQNTEGVNVTRFEFSVDQESTAIVHSGQLSFGDGCDPPAVTCFDQLALVKSNIEAFAAELTGDDAYFANGALDCICWTQSDIFWEQPSGNRLTQYGGSMFIGAAYAICYLEWVDDPQADVLIDEIIAVLECIVDHEIAYAIENGGSQCYIENAEAFAELGGIIDEDFDNEVVATLAYRLAWLHAYYATY